MKFMNVDIQIFIAEVYQMKEQVTCME